MKGIDEIERWIMDSWGGVASNICRLDGCSAVACQLYGLINLIFVIDDEGFLRLCVPILNKDYIVPRPFQNRRVKLDSPDLCQFENDVDLYLKSLIPRGRYDGK